MLVNPATSFNDSLWPLLGPLLPQVRTWKAWVAVAGRTGQTATAAGADWLVPEPGVLSFVHGMAAACSTGPCCMIAARRCRLSCTERCPWHWRRCWATPSTCWLLAWRAGGQHWQWDQRVRMERFAGQF